MSTVAPDPYVGLRRRLTWLTIFRMVANTLLLGVVAGRLFTERPQELAAEDSLSFGVIALVYLVNIVYGLILRSGRVGRGVAYAQVLGDILFATCLVYLTGGAESPFTFAYTLAVVPAAILLYQRGALIAASVSAISFTVLALSISSGLLSSSMHEGALPPGRLAYLIVSNALAQLLIAVLASYLARQLRLTGGELSAREADLRHLYRLQQQILSSVPSGLITCVPDGRVTFVNRAAAQILELEEGNDGVFHLDEIIPDFRQVRPGGPRGEVRVTRGGRERVLGLSVTRMEGEVLGLLVVFQDLTELRRTEEALRRSDRLAALGTLSAQLAHEIRNPLAAMRGSAQMLASEPQADEASQRLADILVRESDRLGGLVEDFLRFARPAAPAKERVCFDALVRETIEMVQLDPLSEGVDLTAELEEVFVEIDPDQLRQVLLNLLRNALAATGAGGKVVVRTLKGYGQVRLQVWDSAGRIAPGDLRRIFDPFFTTRSGGTGLGLSTAHSIVTSHGGTISARSSPEEGTELTVELPLPDENVLEGVC